MAICLLLGACSGGPLGQGGQADKDDGSAPAGAGDQTGTGSGTDEPAWVNATYLTCDWQSAASTTEAGVRCALEGDAAKTGALSIEQWRVTEGDRPYAASSSKVEQGVVFVLPARRIIDMAAVAKVTDGAFSKDLSVAFRLILDGLKGDGALAACFNTELGVADCFAALGIQLPAGDVFTKGMIDPSTYACNDKSALPPGVACAFRTDGLAGDWDQAREWYKLGNDLLAPDGSIKAGDFCDANGLKAVSPRGAIDRTVRWYPMTKPLSQPCFTGFVPRTLDDRTLYGAPVLFDPAQGKDGEPYCYFMILSEQTYFGGINRMHIILNPKLFPNAANKAADLSRAALLATGAHFKCGP